MCFHVRKLLTVNVPALTLRGATHGLQGSGAPLVDKAGAKKWGSDPRYQAYVSGTSFLVPWFPATLPPE